MKSLYIGSGDIAPFLSGVRTQGFQKLLRRFVSDELPNYNALASPIDALRTGAILEKRYLEILPDDYYIQCKETCKEYDVLKCSIDFGKYNKGKIVDFDELKTCNFDDFLTIKTKGIDYIKKSYKNNYRQVQFQLLCSGLDSANLVFLVVYSYDDEENENRVIQENEHIKFRIERDEEIVSKIKDRAEFFQNIKDYLLEK